MKNLSIPKVLCLLLFSTTLCLTAQSQTVSENPQKVQKDTVPESSNIHSLKNKNVQYHVWMVNTNSSYKHRIHLLNVGDDHIEFYQFGGPRKVKAEEISMIRYREKGAVGKGIFRGAIFGALIGGAIGFLSGDDEPSLFFSFTKEEKAIMAGFSGAAIGAVIGGFVSSVKVRIPIEGKSELFQQEREHLKKLVY